MAVKCLVRVRRKQIVNDRKFEISALYSSLAPLFALFVLDIDCEYGCFRDPSANNYPLNETQTFEQ